MKEPIIKKLPKFTIEVEIDMELLNRKRLNDAEIEPGMETLEEAIHAEMGWVVESGIFVTSIKKKTE